MVGKGLDFHFDKEPFCGPNCSQPAFDAIGTYSSFLIAKQAVKVIEKHDTDKPLFLYLAFQDTHSPAEFVPSYRDRYNNTIPDMVRRVLAAKLTTVDEGLANVTAALKAKGMDENLLLVFTADNGGPIKQSVPGPTDAIGANNWPLRGGKHTAYEGGVRVAGFVHGTALYKSLPRPLTEYSGTIEAGRAANSAATTVGANGAASGAASTASSMPSTTITDLGNTNSLGSMSVESSLAIAARGSGTGG
jgi:hypothetical protein